MDDETAFAWIAERLVHWLLAGAFSATQTFVATGGVQTLAH
jgi:hypothetical protein